jgi:DNA recombination protein RmuC
VTTTAIALVGIAALAVALLLVVTRGRRSSDAALLHQQLIDLRAKLDDLVVNVPRALADGSREQHRVLADLRERLGELGETTRQLRHLGESVARVQELLRVPRLRGTLGEVWLEEVLRQMLPPTHYTMQYAFKSGERVDAVVRVGDRLVPVDAKFPLEACERMLATEGDAAERERRAFHRSVKARVDEIAERYIRPDEDTYDFALMYIPAENLYYEAMLRDTGPDEGRGVLSHALDRRVIPVSPHTFYAYLLVVQQGLRGLRIEARARELIDQLGALAVQFDAYWTAFEKVGAHLANAARQYAESERQAGRVRDRFAGLVDADDGASKPGAATAGESPGPGLS